MKTHGLTSNLRSFQEMLLQVKSGCDKTLENLTLSILPTINVYYHNLSLIETI